MLDGHVGDAPILNSGLYLQYQTKQGQANLRLRAMFVNTHYCPAAKEKDVVTLWNALDLNGNDLITI